MPTAPAGPGPLTGLAAQLASLPLSQSLRGGAESGFIGQTQSNASDTPGDGQDGAPSFAGTGPFLELPDAKVFDLLEGLVIRQELIAQNHLAQDSHWTFVKRGYPWSTLTKIPGKDQWEQRLPYGVSGVTTQAVPNKVWHLVNEATSTILEDFPEVECQPLDDSDEAEGACDLANRFLSQDASEDGTNDAVLFNDRVNRALTTATTYLEAWLDPTGGGYVPLQILAHPQAQDPANPLIGPDGMPTPSPVLRYVTAPEGGQFTDSPADAAPQWQPRIRATKWGREHLCVFPESQPVDTAEKLIVKGFCTLGEAKLRWPAIADMTPEQQGALCDWTPIRYLPLLPPFQRARWKLTDGLDKDKGTSSDERILFYYHVYQRPTPLYPKGADVVVNGALAKTILHKALLAFDLDVPQHNPDGQGAATVKETRCRTIPVVQITPVGDPDEQDPTGVSFIELFAGACENKAFLQLSLSEQIDKILHVERFIVSTSPVDEDQIADSRATGSFIPLLQASDRPFYGEVPQFPTGFFQFVDTADEAINAMANQERAAQGAENSKEVSGKALTIAIGRNNMANTGKQTAVMNAYARWNRIKLEYAQQFTTPMQIRFIGEDGASQQRDFVGTDFALVGKVTIKAGTGTMLTPNEKVDYLGSLVQHGMLPMYEAMTAARPVFSKRLGLAPNPFEQYVERCTDAWLDGPPTPEWAQQYATWKAAKDQHDQAMALYQQQLQQFQQAEQLSAVVAGGPPPPTLGPEGQNAAAMQQYQQAVIGLRQNPYGSQFLANAPPTTPQTAPVPETPEPAAPAPPQADPHEAVSRTLEQVAKLMPQSHPPAPQTIHVHTTTGKPKKKKSHARRMEDGSFEIETIEDGDEGTEQGEGVA